MRASRRLSLSAHGSVEALCGMAIMLSPIVLPVGAAGLVALATVGALVTGAGLGVISSSDRAGVSSSGHHSILAHTGVDGLLVLASSAAALALAIAGEAPAALALAVLVAVEACLNFATSYATAS